MNRRRLFHSFLLVMLPLLVYLPSLSNELIWDDQPIIRENELLNGSFSPLAPFRSGYWATTSQRNEGGYDYYRPVMILSFMAEKAVWGLSPLRLRLTNLFLFLIALLALYSFLVRQTQIPGVAETATLLFALFPLHLDNIVWVVGRCDLLMLLFGILALLLFDRYLERRNLSLGLLALGCYMLALLSKEAALFFLPLFPLHELLRRRRLSAFITLFPLLATLGFWLLKSAVIGRGGFPMRPFPGLWENVRPVLGVLGYYARSAVLPFGYDMFLPVGAVQTSALLVSGAAFALILVAIPIFGRRRSELLQAWFWIAPFVGGALLLVFTPIYPFSISTRYLMIPAIGWMWLLAHVLVKARPWIRNSLLVILFIAFASSILAESTRYRDELAFWKGALDECPNEPFFLYKAAQQLALRGDPATAETMLRRSLMSPMNPATAGSVALTLAVIKLDQAYYPESLHWLSQAGNLPLGLAQRRERANRLWKINLAMGNLAAAEKALLEIQPSRAASSSLLELYLSFADWDRARRLTDQQPRNLQTRSVADIDRLEQTFRSWSLRERAKYFEQQGNFSYAWDLWRQEPSASIAERLMTARLALLAGQEATGQELLARLAAEGNGDFRLLNSIGNLLFDLHRGEEAIPFYQQSLSLFPEQPTLRERISWIGGKRAKANSDRG